MTAQTLDHIMTRNPMTYNFINSQSDIMKANISQVLSDCTSEDITTGRDWYHVANEFAKRLAQDYSITLEQSAGIISAISPRQKWNINKQHAEQLIIDPYSTIGAYKKNVLKAQDILFGSDPLEVLGKTRQDKKTFHFYKNIIDPTCADYVTIDTWAMRILILSPSFDGDGLVKLNNTGAKYRTVCAIYSSLAQDLELLPNVLQAIVWTHYERLYGKDS